MVRSSVGFRFPGTIVSTTVRAVGRRARLDGLGDLAVGVAER